MAATLQILPGASFVVNGAARAGDSALTAAAAEMKRSNDSSLAATVEGEVSQVTRSDAGKGPARESCVMRGDIRPPIHRIPASLHVALWFVVAIWIVGLIALLIGAPREMVLATAVIGTGGGLVEWMAHREG